MKLVACEKFCPRFRNKTCAGWDAKDTKQTTCPDPSAAKPQTALEQVIKTTFSFLALK